MRNIYIYSLPRVQNRQHPEPLRVWPEDVNDGK